MIYTADDHPAGDDSMHTLHAFGVPVFHFGNASDEFVCRGSADPSANLDWAAEHSACPAGPVDCLQ